mgnify:CR=1 FL=1|tara:strand:+ start:525 stop:836 length:312 start_codon:yes stop_codon:yes gene_type:complete
MKPTKNVILLSFLGLFLISCTGLSDAGKVLRNEKRTTDEFLIKKSEPLSQPPDFKTIPKPGSIKKEDEKEIIEKILNLPDEDKNNPSNKSSSTEQSILKQIKK